MSQERSSEDRISTSPVSEPNEEDNNGRDGHHTDKPSDGGSQKVWLKPRNMVLLAIVLAVVLTFGIHHWLVAAGFESTDDAYLTSDVVQVAPQVTGTVKQVLVKENQSVKAGDLLVVLDDAQYRATVAQRQADLDAAIAQAEGAGVNVDLISKQGNAQLTQAQGGVEQATSAIAGAKADLARSESAVKNAMANAQASAANAGAAESAVNSAVVAKRRYGQAVNAAEAQIEAAKAAVRTAQANVDAATAVYDKTARDAERYATLLSQGATSEQKADEADAAAAAAKAQLESARQQVAAANSVVLQKQADLNAAKDQLAGADAAIAQARSQLAAARAQASAAGESVHQAEAQRDVATQAVHQAEARRQQALGQLQQAQTAPSQVKVSQSARQQAAAKVEQARAALATAKLQLSYTKIYAPSNGRVSKNSVEVGALVQPGTPLMAEVVSGTPWVAANFKETQLSGIRRGCPAEVRVDALPGHVFEARVESVSPATGSIFALLPADNATGNFTKVVQRIPVKIVLKPGQRDADRLSAGMSVVASVRKQ